jgi:hypothetical protein
MTWDCHVKIDTGNATCYVGFGNITHTIKLMQYLTKLKMDKQYNVSLFEEFMTKLKTAVHIAENASDKTHNKQQFELQLLDITNYEGIISAETYKDAEFSINESITINIYQDAIGFSMCPGIEEKTYTQCITDNKSDIIEFSKFLRFMLEYFETMTANIADSTIDNKFNLDNYQGLSDYLDCIDNIGYMHMYKDQPKIVFSTHTPPKLID